MGKEGVRTWHRLTAVRVASLKKAGLYCDGGGLYFRVAPGGSRGWIFRYGLNGRKRDKGLGGYPATSLQHAREAAHTYRKQVANGFDPVEAEAAARAGAVVAANRSMTFEECAGRYIAAHEPSWRNAVHRAQWRASLASYAFPILAAVRVEDIDTPLVMRVLQPLWVEKSETASRLRGRIETILNWCKANGFREGENPARWRGHLDQLLPAKHKVRKARHHPALPYGELPRFIGLLRSRHEVSAAALEFAILTCARTNEVLGARWPEIDLHRREWRVPAERMKAKRPHRVPLSARVGAILKQMANIKTDDFVFNGARPGRGMSQMSLLMLLRRMGYGHVTVHGFRSSFRDWCAECTDHASEVAELALAHQVSSATERAYLRGDLLEKRRKLMEEWASHCEGNAGRNWREDEA